MTRRYKAQSNETVKSFTSQSFVTIEVNSTVAEAILRVRQSAEKDNIFYVYVIDSNKKLCGTVSIRNLLLAKDDDTVSVVYSSKVVSILETLPIEEAYAIFSRSKFLSLPVINDEGYLTGVLPAHELVKEYNKEVNDLFEERSRGELFELLGIKAEGAGESLLSSARGRLPWLLVNLLGGTLSAFFIHHFGVDLKQAVIVLAFVPVLLVVAESIGMQTASMVISQFHRTASTSGFWRLFLRETGIGLLVGTSCGAIMGAGVYLWFSDWALTMAIFGTLSLGALLVATVSALIPFFFHRLHIDPRVAAGPVVLSLADSGVLLLYLLTSLWLAA